MLKAAFTMERQKSEQQANCFVLGISHTCILMHPAVLEAGLAEAD